MSSPHRSPGCFIKLKQGRGDCPLFQGFSARRQFVVRPVVQFIMAFAAQRQQIPATPPIFGIIRNRVDMMNNPRVNSLAVPSAYPAHISVTLKN